MNQLKYFGPTLFITLLIAFILTSCKSPVKPSDSAVAMDEKDSIIANLKTIVFPLPSPFELYQKLDEIGASYVGRVLNPVGNIDKYYTEKNKALNLGVYAADLSYVTTYNKQQEIQLYSKNLKTLIDQLNLNINYLDFYSEETRQKLENKDSLVVYITEVYYETYKSLYATGDPSLAALMLTGVWAEGLYIATHISDNTFANIEIVKIIFDQKKSLNILIDQLKRFAGNEFIDSYIKALESVKATYDKADTSLTKEQLDEILKAIAEIRNSIVS